MEYRREIDGLRAIAVIPVIIFHAGVPLFRGGFVGVDIFFVISGYLITSILVRELEDGKYSILRFYERRARRILPALFVVILAAMPFAWLLMTPDQLKEFGQSLVSMATFCSNVLFWKQSGYFDGNSELKPFLHTWSLAVEEQYYLLFPPVLALIWRWGRKVVFVLLAITALASLAMSEFASHHYESANFYLAPTRAWELLGGGLCAMWLTGRTARNSRQTLDQLGAGAGLAMIVYAIIAFNDQMRFPGLAALIPVGGTMLIILFATPATLVARLLSMRAFVGVGLISYSAYLWHQPLFAFARLQSLTEPPLALMIGLGFASLILAALSWRYVERPFRKAPDSFVNSRAKVFMASGAVAAILIGAGVVYATVLPGYMALKHPEILIKSRMLAYEPQVASLPCPGFPNSDRAVCRRLGDGPRRVVIWGDSHANALSEGAYPLPGYSIFIIGHWGCPPMIGVARRDTFGNAYNCDSIGMTDVYGRYARSLRPEAAFLVARWTLYANGRHYQSKLQRDTYYLTDGRRASPPPPSFAVMMAGIGRTVREFEQDHARVYVVEQAPDLHDYSPRGLLTMRAAPRGPIDAWHASERRILAEAQREGATVVPTHDLFCKAGQCALRAGDQALYVDDSHVSYYGATPIFRRMVALLR